MQDLFQPRVVDARGLGVGVTGLNIPAHFAHRSRLHPLLEPKINLARGPNRELACRQTVVLFDLAIKTTKILYDDLHKLHKLLQHLKI